jgi:hypothetical protein
LRPDFASVFFRHYYIKQDQVRPKIPGAQMSPAAVIFFEDQIAASLFEKNFDQVSASLSLSTIRMRRISLIPKAVGVNLVRTPRARISWEGNLLRLFCSFFWVTLLAAGFLAGQPGDKPCAEESDY